MWDPHTYLRYGDERSRPFVELVARVGAERPRAVVDLGCGAGNLTALLAERWPDARVTGLDSSPEMVAEAVRTARSHGLPVEFAVGDVRDWTPPPDVDVVVSSAALHWVPGHEELLTGWTRRLPPGGWLAVQVPGNFDAPSHQVMREVVAEGGWTDRLAAGTSPRTVPDAIGYVDLLTAAGCAVDGWETTYVHVLRADDDEHPVLRWMEGTALRPVRAALDDAEWTAFRDRLADRLAAAYPVRDGSVNFTFRRVFAVARVLRP